MHVSSVLYEMPKSNHIHKSMLLRGVKFPPPALDASDIEATKGRAAKSGRNHGGVPLKGDGRGRNNFNYASSNQYPATHDRQSRGSQNGYSSNPFPVPPPGWQPPPPGAGSFARGPPPPPPGYGSYGRGQPQVTHSQPPGYGYGHGPPGYVDDRRGGGDSYRGNRGRGDPYRGQYRGSR
jgi:5'-3' exoribonuclease 2